MRLPEVMMTRPLTDLDLDTIQIIVPVFLDLVSLIYAYTYTHTYRFMCLKHIDIHFLIVNVPLVKTIVSKHHFIMYIIQGRDVKVRSQSKINVKIIF